jgi:hypothetical protein
LGSSFFIYCYTKIKIFGFNLAVIEEESISDMFIFQVNHHDFLNSSLGGHWKTGGVCPKVSSETISSIQSLSHPYTDRAISWFHQSLLLLLFPEVICNKLHVVTVFFP